MPCHEPVRAWRSRHLNDNGKRPLVFDRKSGFEDMEVRLPCGQCMDCRLTRARDWATRCTQEAACWEHNWFVTLTYSDEHLPDDCSVSKRHHELFMKRLRRVFGKGVRFFMCGEYGSKTNRPHYHYLLFNLNLVDTVPWRRATARKGSKYWVYRSPALEAVWPFGHVEAGEVNYKSASYCAGYIMKKVTGDALEEIDEETGLKPYELVDDRTGEVIQRAPEFSLMSRNPGLGAKFYDENREQLGRLGHCVIDGKRVRVPPYYLRKLAEDDPAAAQRVTSRARAEALSRTGDETPERKRMRQDYTREVVTRCEKSEV